MATIRDIAREAGVSVGTASRALTGGGYVAEDTKKRVLETAERLQYKPVRRHVPKSVSKAVGVVLPDNSFPFYGEFLKYVEAELSNRGYGTFLCNTLGIQGRIGPVLDLLEAGTLCGLIVNADVTKDEIARMEKLPVVSFERLLGPKIPMVSSDHRQGGRIAGNLLREAGCKNVLIVTTRHGNRLFGDYRVEECQSILTESGAKVVVAELSSTILSYRYVREVAAQYMDIYNETDGIFTDDVVAYCCISEAFRRGIAVPDQLKIVGYDGDEIVQIVTPQVTTIAQNGPALARACVDVVLRRVAKEIVPEETLVPVSLQKGGTI